MMIIEALTKFKVLLVGIYLVAVALLCEMGELECGTRSTNSRLRAEEDEN